MHLGHLCVPAAPSKSGYAAAPYGTCQMHSAAAVHDGGGKSLPQKSQALRKCGAPGFFISGESGWIDDQTAALFFFLPVIASMNTAIAPSPVTLQAVPKES